MRAALPPTSAALLGGLLLGDRTALPRDLDDAFRRAGVYHVLAVSGFNVALLATSVFALLVMARAGRRPAAVVAMAAVIAFACVVGPEPSVLRATIMGVLILGAMLLEREASVLNSLALAAPRHPRHTPRRSPRSRASSSPLRPRRESSWLRCPATRSSARSA